jgi:hypothetical protein
MRISLPVLEYLKRLAVDLCVLILGTFDSPGWLLVVSVMLALGSGRQQMSLKQETRAR